jgi:arylsulfate sulfotransferase
MVLTKELPRKALRSALAVFLSLTLYGCGSSSPSSPTEAQKSDIAITGVQAGVTPFIASVQLAGSSVSQLASVAFTISPMPASVSQAVDVTWNMSALTGRGYAQGTTINLPVFGLYANYQNSVAYTLTFNDGSTQSLQDTIATQPYTDPTGVYLSPTIIKARAAGSTLGFSFFILKSTISPPVIVDTDGQIRWAVPGVTTQAVYFTNGQFVRGSNSSSSVTILQLDGTESPSPTVLPQLITSFNHNMDPGPQGVLADLNGTDSLGISEEDILAEILPFSNQPPAQTFDLATILSSYMLANGDDPTAFVRPGVDWFHMNASTYDASDNSVIVSSRENFLIKLDYTTQNIIWILGDPTKYWYTFPSLRAKALLLDAGGLYPIGQHGVSITSDGYIMVFNDGLGSINQPTGEPAGVTRTYSAVSAYSVDASAMTAHEVWDFDYGQSLYSNICGSSYEAGGKTYLVDYANVGNHARLVGLDSDHNVVFDFQYANTNPCGAAWNAIPVPFENLQIN